MGFCKSDQKSIPVVGFLTHNDCDVLRAKTGGYRRFTHRTIIPPTPWSALPQIMHRWFSQQHFHSSSFSLPSGPRMCSCVRLVGWLGVVGALSCILAVRLLSFSCM